MRRQNLGDLNGYLFEQLERLNEPDMSETELKQEIERSKAVAGIAEQVVNAGNLALRAQKAFENNKIIDAKIPDMLEADTAEKIAPET